MMLNGLSFWYEHSQYILERGAPWLHVGSDIACISAREGKVIHMMASEMLSASKVWEYCESFTSDLRDILLLGERETAAEDAGWSIR